MRTEPFNLEAEQAILGSMLIERKTIDYVIQQLAPSDFYMDHHKTICETIYSLYSANKPVDLVTVDEKLPCFEYLAQLANNLLTTENIKHHVAIVKGKAIRRNYIAAAKKVIDQAYEGHYENIIDFKNDVQQMMDLDIGVERKEIQDMSIIVDVMTDMEKKNEGGDVIKTRYGFNWVDKMTGGTHDSELSILAARPSVGKTALACQIGVNIARQKKSVAIFSLEMSNKQLASRILANVAGIESEKIRNVSLMSEGDWKRISGIAGNLIELPIYFHDTAFKVEEIRSFARQLKNRGKLDYIIIDYLQLCDTMKKCNNTNDRVSHISRQFKLLAKELQVPILLLSQLSRKPEEDKRRPQLTDLRDSGSIEQDADNVFFLHDASYGDYEQSKNEMGSLIEFIIAKQRNGVRDVYNDLKFYKGTQRWGDA